MHKYDIVNGLAAPDRAGRYLEICTPSTGTQFAGVDPARFATRHRLMYNCPESFDDGQEFSFRIPSLDVQDPIRAMVAMQPGFGLYDVVFVDPWHTYAAGIIALHGAMCLLRPTGIMVVHDCNPTDAALVSPEYHDGAWCGVTYQAYIDFVLESRNGGFCTVDCDYGCGVVCGPGRRLPDALPQARPDLRTTFEWSIARERPEGAYPVFDRYRASLLNLVAPIDFSEAFGMPLPPPAPATAIPDLANPAPGPDALLSLVADGTALETPGYADGWHRFELPGPVRDLRVASPTFSPRENDPASTDSRALGLPVCGVRLDGFSIDLADPHLAEGWHPEEATGSFPWRWTNGNARIRVPPGTRTVELFTANRRG